MKVALEARALAAPGGGVKTYVENLSRELKGFEDIEMSLFTERPGVDILLPWWLEVQVPRAVKAMSPDLVHFTKAAVPRRVGFPVVTTIYDLIPVLLPQSQKWYGRWMWPVALKRAASLSDQIITISESSKRDIMRLFGVDSEKITVTPLAVDTSFFKPGSEADIEKITMEYDLNDNFVLFVGTIEPRKNVPALVRAFSSIARNVPHHLVIAGRHYKGWDDVQKEIDASSVKDRIKVIDFVTSEELTALYSAADLLAWPSVYEGWGLPPQEAMACGTPVIVSNGGALPEVVGTAGSVVDFSTETLSDRFDDVAFEKSFASEMERLLLDAEERKRMGIEGLERVKKFTWQEVASRTLAVYKACI